MSTEGIFKGKFFHEFDGRVANRQGHVVDEDGQFILVRYFDWLAGGESWGMRAIPKTELATYQFYESDKEMREAYEYGGLQRIPNTSDGQSFLAGINEALQEESEGKRGKTLEELRLEHGLTH